MASKEEFDSMKVDVAALKDMITAMVGASGGANTPPPVGNSVTVKPEVDRAQDEGDDLILDDSANEHDYVQVIHKEQETASVAESDVGNVRAQERTFEDYQELLRPQKKKREVDFDAVLDNYHVVGNQEETGPPISAKLAKTCKDIAQLGLPKERLDEIMDKYVPPENCKEVCPVRINEQIFMLLQQTTRLNDAKRKKQQTKQAKGMIALLQAIDEVQNRGREEDDELRETLVDAFSLFCICEQTVKLE